MWLTLTPASFLIAMIIRSSIFIALVAFVPILCASQEITVAAAADLQFAMPDIASQFQRHTGKKVNVVYGSSGNFFQQIENGAPFDMFFSANLDYPKKLQDAGLVEAGTFHHYANGKIVIWVPNDSRLNIGSGLKMLLDPAIHKIAIANPLHAPYGQAAVSAMQKKQIYESVKDKLVLGESVSQAASFVVSGSAEIGIVALSLARSPAMKNQGRYTELPSDEYPPIEQACVILSGSKNKEIARHFLEFMQTQEAMEILANYGFSVPKPQ